MLIPVAPNFAAAKPVPVTILQRRLVHKGNVAAPQVLTKWAHLPEDMSTWEDYYVLKTRFPDAALWEDEQAQDLRCQGGKLLRLRLPTC